MHEVLMIHVVIDTNIYRRSPRLDSPEFKSLSYLARNSHVKLHVPYFIEREFTSHLEHEQRKRLTNVIKGLTHSVNYSNAGVETKKLLKISENLAKKKGNLVKERGDSFIAWLSYLKAKRHLLSEEETKNALDAYFEGKPPFKEPKLRKHIPDSFIFQNIMALYKDFSSDLCIVVHDGSLREACEKKGLLCFESLNQFLKYKPIAESLREKIIDENFDQVTQHVLTLADKEKSLILDKIEEFLLSDDYRLISGDDMPGENNEIYVSGVYKPHSITFQEVDYYGETLFVVNFTGVTEFDYQFPVYHSDLATLDSEKYCPVEWINDHYIDVEATDDFSFKGQIEFGFDVDLGEIDNFSELKEALGDPLITVVELHNFKVMHNNGLEEDV